MSKFRLKLQQTTELTILILIILLSLIFFGINRVFFSANNIQSIFKSMIPYFVMGSGMTLVIITRNLDLSIGAVAGLTSIAVGFLLNLGFSVYLSILLALFVGIFIGLINGLLVSYLKWPSLIVTLGTMYVTTGISLIVTKGDYYTGFPDTFKSIAKADFLNIPLIVILALLMGIFFYILLEFTKFGYSIKSIGGNEDAALSVGIRVNRLKVSSFIICSLCGSLAGIIISARTNIGSVSVGFQKELYAIATVIIGGTSLYGGVGTIFGTLLGALFLSVMENGLVIINAEYHWRILFVGIILLLAVGLDTYRKRKMWQISS